MQTLTINDPQRDLLPGDIGFKTDLSAAGRFARAGQWLLRDDCRYWHAFIVIQDASRPHECVEAMPRGARIASLDGRTGEPYAYVRLPLSPEQREAVSMEALSLVAQRSGRGIGYSFADYLALALWEKNIPGRNVLRGYVKSSNRMICSQLVDYVLCEAGFHLFNDGRLPQDVTPGDLFWQAGAIGRAAWWPIGGHATSVASSDQG